MLEQDRRIAIELKSRIEKIVQLVDFRIFGSRARGDADQYSDLDVFIEIERTDEQTERSIRDLIWETGFKHDIYIAPLIFTRHEIEETALDRLQLLKILRLRASPYDG
jgi:predicted nucleotidyltransferase